MEAPSTSDISSRLERATRSTLASFSFSSTSTYDSSSSLRSPSLSDIIAHDGPANALRCSHCYAQLLRGGHSLYCFACGAPFESSSLPHVSFTSSLAYRQLLDALQIDGLVYRVDEDDQFSLGGDFQSAAPPLEVSAVEPVGFPLNDSYYGEESRFKISNDVFEHKQQTSSQEQAGKIVDTLLARLHDLSFMLANDLVIKSDGNGNSSHYLIYKNKK